MKRILEEIRVQFGELKVQWKTFTHCGVKHVQDNDYTICIDQNDYIRGIRTIDVSHLRDAEDGAALNEADHAKFRTLLGALSWITLTRYDVSVYVTALQRAAAAPRKEHLCKCNRIVKWLRKHQFVTKFKPFDNEQLKVIVVSDAAFKKEVASGLSIRGAIIGIGHHDANTPGGAFHVIEAYSRKQRRVTRSTLAAETQAALDAYETGKSIASALHQLFSPEPEGGHTTLVMHRVVQDGPLHVPVEVCSDCRSLFDMIVAGEQGKNPAEGTLIFPVDVMRQDTRLPNVLKAFYWVDTRDCIADGLTKGTVARAAIMSLLSSSHWVLEFPCQRFSMPSGRVTLSCGARRVQKAAVVCSARRVHKAAAVEKKVRFMEAEFKRL